VCEKNAACEHDFTSEPLELITDGDYVWAGGTTLGADNGIAVAYAMALLEGDYKHPPLEVVLTTDEETGMNGAAFLDVSLLSGRRLINIDEETEGHLVVSCAGGVRSEIHIPIEFQDVKEGTTAVLIEIKGLKGGHSGMEINKQRANANILMGRLLFEINEKYRIWLSQIKGGLKDNAIPREALALIYINPADYSGLSDFVSEMENVFRNEYKQADPLITARVLKPVKSREAFLKVVTDHSQYEILSLLALMPNGVIYYANGESQKGAVMTPETSLNAGIMKLDENECEFIIQSALRSSVNSRKQDLRRRLTRLAGVFLGRNIWSGDYPAWEYNEKSELRDLFTQTYAETYQKNMEISSTHAGLEGAVFAQKIKGADIAAFGPDIYGAHSPDEKISVTSARRTWEFLLRVLEKM